MPNAFTHSELNTTDVPSATKFYAGLFDWKLEDLPGYTMIATGKGHGGGILQHPVPGAGSAWLTYIEVDDIVAATQKAASLGGTIMKDVTEVMDAGRISIIIDPTGAAFGLWQGKSA